MGKPLLDVLRDLALDPAEQAAFESDPDGYMAQFGYDDMPAGALDEAVDLVADTLPPDVAAGIAPADGGGDGDEVMTLQRLTGAGDAAGEPTAAGPDGEGAADPVDPAHPGSTSGTDDLTRGFGEVDFDNGSDVAAPAGPGDATGPAAGEPAPAGDGAGGPDGDGATGTTRDQDGDTGDPPDDVAFGSGSPAGPDEVDRDDPSEPARPGTGPEDADPLTGGPEAETLDLPVEDGPEVDTDLPGDATDQVDADRDLDVDGSGGPGDPPVEPDGDVGAF